MMFVALSVAIFCGISWTGPALQSSADQVFEEGKLHDFEITYPYGLTEDDHDAIRAIVGKPKILFFDEAISALDNTTQTMVCESLARLNVTRVVIAHRLSTIADCDRILVMDYGRIVEEGNFETLMEKKGLFYELASRQMA